MTPTPYYHPTPTNGPGKASRGFNDLVRRAQSGDREAMDRVLVILQPYLEHLASPFADPARRAASTADLLQDSCLRAWQKVESFQGADNDDETFAMFRAWIGQIVRRLGLNAQRDRKALRRRPHGDIQRLGGVGAGESTSIGIERDPPSREPSPSANLHASELDRRIRKALEELPDRKAAEIVRLHFFEGLKLAEISRRLEMGYDAVRDRYIAAMEKLERKLDGWP